MWACTNLLFNFHTLIFIKQNIYYNYPPMVIKYWVSILTKYLAFNKNCILSHDHVHLFDLINASLKCFILYWDNIYNCSANKILIRRLVIYFLDNLLFDMIVLELSMRIYEKSRENLLLQNFQFVRLVLVKENPPLSLITTWRFHIATIWTNKRIAIQFVQFFPNLFYWNVIWAMKPTNFTPTPTK